MRKKAYRGISILVVPDAHARPQEGNARFTALGNFIEEKNPDVVVNIGDLADMGSLSSYDKGTFHAEGRRYKDDLNAVRDALKRIHKPSLRRRPITWYLTLGNHEHRITRASMETPELYGTLTLEDLHYEKYGYHVVPYLKPLTINGVVFQHYFTSGIMGRPISGENHARTLVKKNYISSVCGHCFSSDTELLTPSGWKGMDEVTQGDIVCTMNLTTGGMEPQPVQEKMVYDYEGEMYHLQGRHVDHLVTPRHGMVYANNGNPRWKRREMKDVPVGAVYPVATTHTASHELPLNDEDIQLIVAIAADGSEERPGYYRFNLVKPRKVERLQSILNGLTIEHTTTYKEGRTRISFHWTPNQKGIPATFAQLSTRQAAVFLNELEYWDGHRYGRGVQYYTTKAIEADIVQRIAVMNGYRATIGTRTKPGYTPGYTVYITKTMKTKPRNVSREWYKGQTWCVTVENHTLIARRNGKVLITQNSHARDYWEDVRADGQKTFGLVVGCFDTGPHHYTTEQKRWWSGLVILHEVQDGRAEPAFYSTDYILRKYG